MTKKRPTFSKAKVSKSYDSPEELFGKLPNRAKSHGYLRAPQVDALREYLKHKNLPDVALELPTGTGKTTVGLLIAEWRRRMSQRPVAYLALTNQLAGQVLGEAAMLGLACADLRGTRDTRSAVEVGRYKTAQAVGVTVYSNLFNVNPVVQESDVLVLDDAHGGEQAAAAMWSVRIGRGRHQALYDELLGALRPALSDQQYENVTLDSSHHTVEIADVWLKPDVLDAARAALNGVEEASLHFPWHQVAGHLHACMFLVSFYEIVIRPLIPPTHSHKPFAQSSQRVYLSATYAGAGDLQRGYGVNSVETIQAQHPQWGRRYIFVPELYLPQADARQVVQSVWGCMQARRALMLAPSFQVTSKAVGDWLSKLTPAPTVMEAKDIEDSLEAFVDSEEVVLALSGRYDGIDLPGDDCRLLVLLETPSAIGPLEKHQRDRWKLGVVFRKRERTRLVQGIGRCTRDATDYAVVLLLGQSLVDTVANTAVTSGLPSAVQRELQWAMIQGEGAKSHEELAAMIAGLLEDEDYRKEANVSIEETQVKDQEDDAQSFDQGAKLEVVFARTMWEGNFSVALETAKEGADAATDPALAGYRAWWLYLASLASRQLDDLDAELDALNRARATGVNAGMLDQLIRSRTNQKHAADELDSQAEAVWNWISELGWHGTKFADAIAEMSQGLTAVKEPTKFHIGLERLGQFLGMEALRPTGQGDPDVVWLLGTQGITFEVKSEKGEAASLPKKDVLQANGHVNWLQKKRPETEKGSITAVIVASSSVVDDAAKPHLGQLRHTAPAALQKLGEQVAKLMKSIRSSFAGKEFPDAAAKLKQQLKVHRMDLPNIQLKLLQPLAGKS